MMRSLWTVISCLAVAHILAVAGFVLWLRSSDRLDMVRLERIREVLAPTRAEESVRLAEASAERQRQAAVVAKAAYDAEPPVRAGEQVLERHEAEEVQQARLERVRREVEDLRRTLALERADLDARTTAFEKKVSAFEAMRKLLAEHEGDEQFRKAVELYGALPAAKAQELLQTLVDEGKTDQVVAYLNRMEPRAAKKIIEKFPDPKLAADLLERLRTLGVEARSTESP